MKSKNETVIETKGTHKHNCDPNECKAKEVVNQIKRKAQYSIPTVPIANEISKISDDYAVQPAMPKKTTCCEQPLENDEKICASKNLPQLIDILMSLMSLLPSSYKIVEKMIRSGSWYLKTQQW